MDFFFIGRSTEHREKYFSHLKHKYNFLHIAHGMWGNEIVPFINQSKILLNVHAENEISWEPRVQMLMATGNMLITEKLSYNNLLEPGIDYIEVSSPEECIEKAEYYLKNKIQREKIAKNGLRKIEKYFDSNKNFKQLIDGIFSGKYSKFRCEKKSSFLYYQDMPIELYYILYKKKLLDIFSKK
jgi:hypothetical protein